MRDPPAVPLIALSSFQGDPERWRRVQVLHETIDEFKKNGTRLTEMAAANLGRWAAAKTTQPSTSGGGMRLEVVQGDLLETLHKLTKLYGVMFAGINMANATFPGGGYTEGCTAQEENMARRTDMHFTFTEKNTTRSRNGVVYTKPMQELVDGKGGVVYLSETPLTCIKGREEWERDDLGYKPLADDDVFPFLELRSAAVDISHMKRVPADLRSKMMGRIRAQFETLKRRGVRHAVLSAFGCGAFGNRPQDVAAIYKEVLAEYEDALDVVVFAIYYAGHGENNFDIFHKTLVGSGESQPQASGNANGKRPMTTPDGDVRQVRGLSAGGEHADTQVPSVPHAPGKLKEPLIFLSKAQEPVVRQHLRSLASYVLPAWVPHRLIGKDLGFTPKGIQKAEAFLRRPYLWAPEFENVHRLFRFDEPQLEIGGVTYACSEAYYQSQKPDPFDAATWDVQRDAVMETALRAKLAADPHLVALLRATKHHPLLALKPDKYWGFDAARGGENKLAKLWERLRHELAQPPNVEVSFTDVYLDVKWLAQQHHLHNLGYMGCMPPRFHIHAESYAGWYVDVKSVFLPCDKPTASAAMSAAEEEEEAYEYDKKNVLISVNLNNSSNSCKVYVGNLRAALVAAVAPNVIAELRNRDIAEKKHARKRRMEDEEAKHKRREQEYAARRADKNRTEAERWEGEQRFVLFEPAA